jgi:hypothetical protein
MHLINRDNTGIISLYSLLDRRELQRVIPAVFAGTIKVGF